MAITKTEMPILTGQEAQQRAGLNQEMGCSETLVVLDILQLLSLSSFTNHVRENPSAFKLSFGVGICPWGLSSVLIHPSGLGPPQLLLISSPHARAVLPPCCSNSDGEFSISPFCHSRLQKGVSHPRPQPRLP